MTLTLTFGNIECYFKLDSTGGLTQSNKILHSVNPYECLSEPAKKNCDQYWEQMQKEYNHAIKIIGTLLNWNFPQEENKIPSEFTHWIRSGAGDKVFHLNLSNRNIKRLPPQIQLFKNLESLDISNNHFLTLPFGLCHLPLKKIDISGNIWMQSRLADCEWLKEKKECKLRAFRINLEHLPKGFSANRIECEIDLNLNDYHYTSIRAGVL